MAFLTRGALRTTIPLFLFLSTLLVGLLFWAVNTARDSRVLEGQAAESVRVRLSQEERFLEYFLIRGDLNQVQKRISLLALDPRIRHAYLLCEDGEILGATRLAMIGKQVETIIPVLSGQEQFLLRDYGAEFQQAHGLATHLSDDRRGIVGVSSILDLPSLHHTDTDRVVLFLYYDLESAKAAAWQAHARHLLEYGGFLTLLALGLWFFFQHVLTRRVEILRRMAGRLAQGDYTARANLDGNDELAELGAAFDRMAQERQGMEEQLHLVRASIDSAQDAICWSDAQGRFRFVNDAACRLLGYSREELLALGPVDIDPGLAPEQWPDHWQRLLACGSISLETELRAKDGQLIPVDVSANMVTWAEQVYDCAFIRDIRERKNSERSLRLAKEEWERTFDAIADIVTILDPDGCIVRANRRAVEIFAVPAGSLQGKFCYEIFRGSDSPCAGCPVRPGAGDREMVSCEIAHAISNRMFQVSLSPIVDDVNRLIGVVHIAKDITEQKQLEGQLQQAQKMEAIGTLAGGIAHDFNNILTPILGYSEMVQAALPPASPAAADIAEVIRGAKRATELVKQILTFSRQTDDRPQPLKVQFVVKEALKLLRSSIPATIAIRQHIDESCPAVLANPVQIHQIVMNLCTNAFHAMREQGGTLGVSLTAFALSTNDLANKIGIAPGPYIRLEVSDTGHGIAPDILGRIFEPYFTTKTKGEGTGLGLSVVHGIVSRLHGAVTVYSEAGTGSTFHVYLPTIAAGPVPWQEEGASDDPRSRGDERVLVVDDEKVIVSLLRQMLAGLGYAVSAFTDSREALAAFAAEPEDCDLVITDMTMPNLTGVQLCREMKAIRPDIPVVLCTGYSELIDREKALALGISEYIMKPVLQRELARIVRHLLDKRHDGEERGHRDGEADR
ncbi:MAG: PAS domain S-box protein [Thermodesulfobacteriota bacterium]